MTGKKFIGKISSARARSRINSEIIGDRLNFSKGTFNDLLTHNLFKRVSFKIVEYLDLGTLMQLNDYLELQYRNENNIDLIRSNWRSNFGVWKQEKLMRVSSTIIFRALTLYRR